MFGSLHIDRDARSVSVAGTPRELTAYQFDLLLALAERAAACSHATKSWRQCGREPEAIAPLMCTWPHPRSHRDGRQKTLGAS